jgi:hypothetical protein
VIIHVEGNINQGRPMPNYKLIVPVVAVALLGATIAIAEVVRDRHEHGGRSDEADSGGWHKEMCADRFAHDTAKIAYLETRLELTDAQRPAFENWKSSVLAAAKSQQDNCAARTADAGHAPTILDRETREELMLRARVAALDAELPSLKALYQTLSPDQKAMLDRPRHDHEGHHHHGGDNWGGRDSREGGPPPATE